MFSFRTFLVRGLLDAVGSQPEYWIILNAAGWMDKGVLTQEDLVKIQEAIDAYNETQTPETPAGDTPEPETPANDTPEPETPADDTPEPETPAGDTPEPETSADDAPNQPDGEGDET